MAFKQIRFCQKVFFLSRRTYCEAPKDLKNMEITTLEDILKELKSDAKKYLDDANVIKEKIHAENTDLRDRTNKLREDTIKLIHRQNLALIAHAIALSFVGGGVYLLIDDALRGKMKKETSKEV